MPEHQPDTDTDAPARPAKIAVLDLQNPQVLTCQNDSFRSAETAVLDLQKPHTSKKEKNKKERSDTERSATVERARERAELDHLIRRCEFELFEPEEQTVLRDAITWLYSVSYTHLDVYKRQRMEGFLQSEGDALCRTCIEDNINEVNQLVRYGAFTTRFYIAYRYEPSMVSGDVSYAKIAAALRQVMDSSVGYLARCRCV